MSCLDSFSTLTLSMGHKCITTWHLYLHPEKQLDTIPTAL